MAPSDLVDIYPRLYDSRLEPRLVLNAVVVADVGAMDTADLSAQTGNLTLDMDSTAVQALANGNTVQLNGQIENYTGNAGVNTVSVNALDGVNRVMEAGAGASDTLNVDAQGQTFTDDGTTLSFGGGYGDIAYSGWETVVVTNYQVQVTGDANDNVLAITMTGANTGTYQLDGGAATNFSGVSSFVFDGGDGDDQLTIDFSGGNLTSDVFFNGGESGETAGDSLTLTGGGAFGTVTHNFSNVVGGDADNGTIAITGNGTITYTGLEPIVDNLNASNRIFNFTGAQETITLSTPGGALHNQIDSTLGESVSFNNPSTSLTINTEVGGGTGADTINISGLHAAFDANLIVNGGTDDNINLNGAVSVGSHTVMLSGAAINGAGLVTATTVDLNAATGIGNTTALQLAATSITADTTAGAIDLNNTNAATATFSSLTTGAGAITVDNSGGGAAIFTTATTSNGAIQLSNAAGSLTVGTSVAAGSSANVSLTTTGSGNVILTGTTTAAGDQVTITSAGAINGAGLVTAATVELSASSGIGNTTPLELAATSISAGTVSGAINLDNTNAAAATFSSLAVTIGVGAITVDNSGGGAAIFTTATTTSGAIHLSNDGGNLTVGTSVAAGSSANVSLTTTGSGNVILTGTTTAAGDQVTVTSAGAINGAGLVTAATVDLNAVSGIGNTTPLELTATSISADTTSGAINLDNTNASMATFSSLRVTGGGGAITVDNSGGGAAVFTTATTTDGAIQLSNAAGNLTVGTNVAAGSAANVSLTTTGSGNVILTGTTTAAGDQVMITSAGAINGAGLVMAATVDLNAVSGIGNTTPLELAATSISADTTSGAINLDNTNASMATFSTLTTGGGAITVDNSGGGAAIFTTATTTNGAIQLSNDSGNLTVGTSVTAGNTANVTLTTTGSGNVILTGATTAAGDQVTVTSAGAISGAGLVTAGSLRLSAATGIGSGAALNTAVSRIAASNATSGNIQVSNSVGGLLTVDTVGALVGVANNAAGGAVVVSNAGELTIDEDVSAAGNITLTAVDDNGAGDDLTVSSGAVVQATAGDVTLRGGDDVTLSAGSTVDASGKVFIAGNFGNADGDATTITLRGVLITVTQAEVLGGVGADMIILDPQATSSGQILLDGQGGNDSYTVNLANLGGQVDVSDQAGEGNSDSLSISGTPDPDVFTVGATQTTLATPAQTVTYLAGLEMLEVKGLNGADTFNVAPSTTAVISILGGAPSGDQLNYINPAGQTPTIVPGPGDSGTITSAGGGGFLNVVYDKVETVEIRGAIVVNGTGMNDVLEITFTGVDAGTYQLTTGGGPADPAVSFSGATSFTFNGVGGDDELRIDYDVGSFSGDIIFNGGETNETDGDSLTLTGGGVFDTVTHNFSNVLGGDADNGTIAITGNGTITYTGLEPIVDNLNANNRIFNFTGAQETITLSTPGGALHNQIDSTLGESVSFNNPNTSLTINTEVGGGTGADTINISGLHAGFAADFTVNGGTDDNINLNGAVSVGNHTVMLSGAAINGAGLVTATTVDLNAATGIGNTTALELAATSISADTTAGAIDLDNANAATATFSSLTIATGNGTITVDNSGGGAAIFTTVTTAAMNGGAIDLENSGGNLTVGTNVAAGSGANVSLTTTSSGNVILTGTTTAALDQVTVTSAGAINGAGLVTALAVDLNAASGIGNTTPLALAARTISADTNSGAIDLDNANAATATFSSLTVANGTGAITVGNSGGGAAIFTTAITNGGAIQLSNTGNLTVGTNVAAGGAGDVTLTTTAGGNVILTGTTAAAADQVTVTSAGAINGAGLVTAATVELNASSGIGNTTALELAATSISADTSSGAIDLDNANASMATFSALRVTTGMGAITVDNSGGGAAVFTTATTTDGAIQLSNAAGNLTVGTNVAAGSAANVLLTTTTSGNVILTGTTTAAGDRVTIASAGAISGAGLVTAGSLGLSAASGIGSGAALNTAVSTIAASNSASGNIQVNNSVGGQLTVGTVSALVGVTNDATVGTIVISNAGPLTVSQNVRAGGNITLTAVDDAVDTAGNEDDLTIGAAVVVQSSAGDVTLRGGDDVVLTAGATVNAAGKVTVEGNFGNADAGTTTISILGVLITVTQAEVLGGAGADAITLNPQATSSGQILLNGQGGNDTYTVQLGNLGGRVDVSDQTGEGAADKLILLGTANADTLTVDAAMTVLDAPAQTVAYLAGLEMLEVRGGDGADTFTVAPSTTAAIEIIGGDPSTSPGDQLNYITQAGQSPLNVPNLAVPGSGRIRSLGGGGFGDVNYQEIEDIDIGGAITIDGTGDDDIMRVTLTGNNRGTYQLTSGGVAGPVNRFRGATTFIFNGGAGNDELVIDYTNGNWNSAVFFNGGETLETVGDRMTLIGGGRTFNNVTHTFSNVIGGDADNGAVSITGNGTIIYTGLEPIEDRLDANNRFFNFAAAAETIALSVSGGPLQNTIDSTIGERVFFNNPNATLTINTELAGGTGADTINFMGLHAAFDWDLTINGGTDDNVNLLAPVSVGAHTVTISGNAINGANLVTAATVDLDAASGIGVAGALRLAAASISADTTAGVIRLDNANAATATYSSLTTGDGAITVNNTGGGAAIFTTVTTANGAISLANDGANLTVGTSVSAGGAANVALTTTSSGSVILNGTTTADANQVTINSAAAINGAGLVTAATVDLNAATGIGNATALELAATSITADTTTGAINLDNANAATATFASLTTDNGSITADNSGGGAAIFTTVTTIDGAILLTNAAGNLTVGANVAAGGAENVTLRTTASGNVILTGTTAAGNQVAITSAGAVNGAGRVTAMSVDLDAVTGIGAATALQLAASTISADSTNGAIDLDNVSASTAAFTSLTTGDGSITVDNSGGGAAVFTTVTTASGAIDLENMAGNLTVGANIAAGGDADVALTTTNSGNVILTGTTTAAQNQVAVNSAGAIDGAGLVTAAAIDLDAVAGIGAAIALELAATSITADTANGAIDLDNANAATATFASLQTGMGAITVDNSGGGAAIFTTATTADGAIDLENTAGNLTVGTNVAAGGDTDITLTTTNSGNVILTGTTTAAGNQVTVNSAGAVNGGGLVTAATVELNAAAGIGATTALELAAASISANTASGAIDLDNENALAATFASLRVTTGMGSITVENSGGGAALFTTATTANGAINLANTAGSLTVGNNVAAGGNADVTLTTTTSGAVILVGATTATGNRVAIDSAETIDGAGQVTAAIVDLDAVAGIGAVNPLQLAATSISAETANGAIDLDNANAAAATFTSLTTGTGAIVIDNSGGGAATFSTVTTIDGAIDLRNAGGNLTVGANVAAGGDTNVTLTTTTSGNVTLTGATTAAGNQVTVNSAGAVNGAGLVTATTVDLNAATGIGAATALELAATSITADTTTGAINLDNANPLDAAFASLTTSAGSITVDNSGGGAALFTTATTADGGIDLENVGGNLTVGVNVAAGGAGDVVLTTTTSGDVILSGTTTADGNRVTVTSAGAIDGAGLVAAATVDLNAASGIGATTELELAATSISADTSAGAIDLDNESALAVTFTSLTTGVGTIKVENSGGGAAVFATAATADGAIELENVAGDLTVGASVVAGGAANISLTTVTSGNVLLVGATTAAEDQVTIESAGAINGGGLVTAATVDLDAASGVGGLTALELSATSISADTASGAIDLDNNNAAAAAFTSLTTAGAGAITVDNSGGGAAIFAIATTADGAITLANTGGNLTVGVNVAAGGAADVALTTRNSGNVILNGTTTAAGDQATITSAGAINGAGLVTAATIDLNAASGIGAATALELTATLITADSTNGAIDLDNDNAGAATFASLTTGVGSITVDNSGGGDAIFTVATTANGAIDLENVAGSLTVGGNIVAGGAANVDLTTTAGGNVILTGTTSAVGNQVTITSAAAIDGAGLVRAATVDLDAAAGIGAAAALELAATTIAADTVDGAIDLDNTHAAAATFASLTTGVGSITVDNSGGGAAMFATVATADGAIDLENAGNLTVGGSVEAGGAANVALTTTASGNVILTGTTTADGDQIAIASAGSINGAGLVTAAIVSLNAASGIGAATPLELNAVSASADTVTGRLDLDNDTPGTVAFTSLTTGSGAIVVGNSLGTIDVKGNVVTMNGGVAIDAAGAVHFVNDNAGTVMTVAAAGAGQTLNVSAGTEVTESGPGAFLFRTADAQVAHVKPIVNAAPRVDTPPNVHVDINGRSELQVRIGTPADPPETNFSVEIDWTDQRPALRFDRFTLDSVGSNDNSRSVTHDFLGNPDQTNPFAPIDVVVTVAPDDSIQFQAGGQRIVNQMVVRLNVPANGLIGSVVVIRQEEAPQRVIVPRPIVVEPLESAESSVTDTVNESLAPTEPAETFERYYVLKIVVPNADGSVKELEEIRIDEKWIQKLPDLFRRLPNDRYRLYLIREDKVEQMVIDVLIEDGKSVGEIEVLETVRDAGTALAPAGSLEGARERASDDSPGGPLPAADAAEGDLPSASGRSESTDGARWTQPMSRGSVILAIAKARAENLPSRAAAPA